jgi:hypothetical protein
VVEQMQIIDLKNVEKEMCNADKRNEFNFSNIVWLNDAGKINLSINNKITRAFQRSSTVERDKRNIFNKIICIFQ